MPDYARMYALLCGAMSEAVDALEATAKNVPIIEFMISALEEAEEIYIQSDER